MLSSAHDRLSRLLSKPDLVIGALSIAAIAMLAVLGVLFIGVVEAARRGVETERKAIVATTLSQFKDERRAIHAGIAVSTPLVERLSAGQIDQNAENDVGVRMYQKHGVRMSGLIDPAGNVPFAQSFGRTGVDDLDPSMLQELLTLVESSRKRLGIEIDQIGRTVVGPLSEQSIAVWADRAVLATVSPVTPHDTRVEIKPEDAWHIFSIDVLDKGFAERLKETLAVDDVRVCIEGQPCLNRQSVRSSIELLSSRGDVVGLLAWSSSHWLQRLSLGAGTAFSLLTALFGVAAFRLASAGRAATTILVEKKRFAEHQLLHDALTGLPNRRRYEQRFAELAAAKPDAVLGVAFFDLDRFKAINDTLGHRAGDAVICESGSRALKALPQGSLVARIAGDEFMALIVGCGSIDEVHAAAAKVVEAINKPMAIDDRTISPSTSLGLSVFPQDGRDLAALAACADAAQYRAKAEGRNRMVAFDKALAAIEESRATLFAALGEASERHTPSCDVTELVDLWSRGRIGLRLSSRLPDAFSAVPRHLFDQWLSTPSGSRFQSRLDDTVLRRACDGDFSGDVLDLALSTSFLLRQDWPELLGRAVSAGSARDVRLRIEISDELFTTRGVSFGELSAMVGSLGCGLVWRDPGSDALTIARLADPAICAVHVSPDGGAAWTGLSLDGGLGFLRSACDQLRVPMIAVRARSGELPQPLLHAPCGPSEQVRSA